VVGCWEGGSAEGVGVWSVLGRGAGVVAGCGGGGAVWRGEGASAFGGGVLVGCEVHCVSGVCIGGSSFHATGLVE